MINNKSSTWVELAHFIDKEILIHQKRLEGHATDEVKTQQSRGNLQAYRKILKLGDTDGKE